MNTKETQEHLMVLGWPIVADGNFGNRTFQAVKDFQRGYAFENLLVDGHAGPKTWAALSYAVSKNGYCSAYFAFREFKSKGDGWIKVSRRLLHGLDRYREQAGSTAIVSGYRDPAHNRKVGGAPNSIHVYGGAVDLNPKLNADQCKRIGIFSGIGIVRATGLVRHLDVRGQDGIPQTTPGTPANPTIWYYG